MLDLGVLGFYFKAWGLSNQHLRIEYLIFNLKVLYIFYEWHICILLGMYIVAFFIGFLFWKSCKFWRRLMALDYIWKSGVGFTLFYFTNLFVEILGRKGSGTMIFIVSWCYGGLAMVIFILFWQGSYPPWWHHTGIFDFACKSNRNRRKKRKWNPSFSKLQNRPQTGIMVSSLLKPPKSWPKWCLSEEYCTFVILCPFSFWRAVIA